MGTARVNPLASAAYDRVAHQIQADVSVMIAANRKNRREFAERADQIAQLSQLGRSVYQVAPQKQGIDLGAPRGF